MSTFQRSTRHPITGEWEDDALWVDDYFGRHNYGVRFSDGEVFDPREFEIETRDVGIASVSLEEERVDVTVTVNSLDVDLSDPSNVEAKRVIEEEIIPALANRDVMVAVVYRHPVDAEYIYAKKRVKLTQVRAYAEASRDAFIKNVKPDADPADFIVVEYYKDTDEVKVTTL